MNNTILPKGGGDVQPASGKNGSAAENPIQ